MLRVFFSAPRKGALQHTRCRDALTLLLYVLSLVIVTTMVAKAKVTSNTDCSPGLPDITSSTLK